METFTVTVTEMPGKVYGQYREGEIMTTIKEILYIVEHHPEMLLRITIQRREKS